MSDAGPVALIAGGTSGIGAATAREFVRRGWSVAVTYSRDDSRSAAFEAELTDLAAAGSRVLVARADATSWPGMEAIAAEVEAALGPIATLVCNVGSGMLRPVEDTDPDLWERMWKVNLESAVVPSMTVGKSMLERGAGSIVHVNAISGLRPVAGRAAHCVAKAGLEMLTRCLALEWGSRGVRANGVAPGIVATAGVREMFKRGMIDEAAAIAGTPQGRLADEDEVARAIAFLGGPEAGFVNGETLLVDGGWSLDGGHF